MYLDSLKGPEEEHQLLREKQVDKALELLDLPGGAEKPVLFLRMLKVI